MLIREAALIVFLLIGSVRGRAHSLLLLFTVLGDTYLQKNIVKLFPKQLACRFWRLREDIHKCAGISPASVAAHFCAQAP